jgi:uncharacterized iron-regulated membrane protein
MPIRILILAHGNLGLWDELIGLVAFAVFLIMLVLPPIMTWWREKRAQLPPELKTPDSVSISPEQPPASTEKRRENHYRLD